MRDQSVFMYTAARVTVCPRCEARPGDPCTTLLGGEPTQPHASRWQPLADMYAAGYRDGIAANR